MPNEDELRAHHRDFMEACDELGLNMNPDEAKARLRNVQAQAEEYGDSMDQRMRRRLRRLFGIEP